MGDFSDDELRRYLEYLADGDREMGDREILEELERRGCVTVDRSVPGWRVRITEAGRRFMRGGDRS